MFWVFLIRKNEQKAMNLEIQRYRGFQHRKSGAKDCKSTGLSLPHTSWNSLKRSRLVVCLWSFLANLLFKFLWSPYDLVRWHNRCLVEVLYVLINIKVGDTTLHHFTIPSREAAEICARLILVSITTCPFLYSRLFGWLRVIDNTNLVHLLPMTLVSCQRIGEFGIHSDRCNGTMVACRWILIWLVEP